jgi:hypothetical protein
MNRQRSLAVLVLLCFLVACASTPDRIAYTSISAATDGVQAALKAWNEGWYQPGVKVDPVLWNIRRDQLAAAYAKFQASANLAVTLAKDITQADNALKIANDAAAQVVALIAELEKK